LAVVEALEKQHFEKIAPRNGKVRKTLYRNYVLTKPSQAKIIILQPFSSYYLCEKQFSRPLFAIMPSLTEENYLKTLYHLTKEADAFVPNVAIAERLGVKASSVTDMLGRLAENGFIEYQRYRGARFLDLGRKTALLIIRKHRLWEVFLHNKLGYAWDEVHPIAEQLEHVDDEAFINRLDDFLGNPMFDPHGDPIPTRLAALPDYEKISLIDFPLQVKARIVGLADHSELLKKHIEQLQILPDTLLTVVSRSSFDQSLTILLEADRTIFISQQTAASVFVIKI
jgi:DtxR family transcriptional regulator, Mn-dependent transcriptional regulator